MIDISWKLPWHPVIDEQVRNSLQKELELEVGSRHTLWGKKAIVIGRRIDNDDILVQLSDDSVARVHLGWSGSIEAKINDKAIPHTVIYSSVSEFISRMLIDAEEYEM